MKTPKTKSTRLVLPRAEAGSADEPANADAGTLSFDDATDTVRIKEAAGWVDLSGGGGSGGTVTSIVNGGGLTVTNPAGPVVTITADVQSINAGAGITVGTAPNYVIAATGGGAPSGPAGGDLAGTYPNPTVAAIHETSGPTKLTIGSITANQLVQRVGSTAVGVTANAALVGLGNVTNDAQLKRSANDWTGFGAITPAGADLVLFEDASAGTPFSKGYSTVTDFATVLAGLVDLSPFTRTPPSPSVWDDEFLIIPGGAFATADLAARGWTFRNLTAAGVMVRVGAVTPNMNTLTALQYNSTILPGTSTLLLQLPNTNQDLALYKAITPVTTGEIFIWAKGGTQGYQLMTGGAESGRWSVAYSTGTGGLWDVGNRIGMQLSQIGNAGRITQYRAVGGAFTSPAAISAGNGAMYNDIVSVRKVGATSARQYGVGCSFSGAFSEQLETGTGAAIIPNFGGVMFNTLNDQPNIVRAIDFIRFSRDNVAAYIAN